MERHAAITSKVSKHRNRYDEATNAPLRRLLLLESWRGQLTELVARCSASGCIWYQFEYLLFHMCPSFLQLANKLWQREHEKSKLSSKCQKFT